MVDVEKRNMFSVSCEGEILVKGGGGGERERASTPIHQKEKLSGRTPMNMYSPSWNGVFLFHFLRTGFKY